MDKFDLSKYNSFADLPLEKFKQAGYSIYVIDTAWNYLFVNDFVLRNLGERSEGMLGKNLWTAFPELATDPAFSILRANTEKGLDTNLITLSPIAGQRLNITGHTLGDCYIFTSSILPKREELLGELRQELQNRKPDPSQKNHPEY